MKTKTHSTNIIIFTMKEIWRKTSFQIQKNNYQSDLHLYFAWLKTAGKDIGCHLVPPPPLLTNITPLSIQTLRVPRVYTCLASWNTPGIGANRRFKSAHLRSTKSRNVSSCIMGDDESIPDCLCKFRMD